MGWIMLSSLTLAIYPEAITKFYFNLSQCFDRTELHFIFKKHLFTFLGEELTNLLNLNPSKTILNLFNHSLDVLWEFFFDSIEPFVNSRYEHLNTIPTLNT